MVVWNANGGRGLLLECSQQLTQSLSIVVSQLLGVILESEGRPPKEVAEVSKAALVVPECITTRGLSAAATAAPAAPAGC